MSFLFPEQISKLIEASHEAKSKAYCRYSDFPVGAALLCDDGTVFKGKKLICRAVLVQDRKQSTKTIHAKNQTEKRDSQESWRKKPNPSTPPRKIAN